MSSDDIRHDHTLRRPVQVFTLCPKCNKEIEVGGSKTVAGIYCAVHTCSKCSTRIDVWIRISIGAEPTPAPAPSGRPESS